jgi:hypothetical protein
MDAYIITGNVQNWVNTRLNQHFPKYLAKALVDLRRQHETDGTIEDWKLPRDLDFNSPSVYR